MLERFAANTSPLFSLSLVVNVKKRTFQKNVPARHQKFRDLKLLPQLVQNQKRLRRDRYRTQRHQEAEMVPPAAATCPPEHFRPFFRTGFTSQNYASKKINYGYFNQQKLTNNAGVSAVETRGYGSLFMEDTENN